MHKDIELVDVFAFYEYKQKRTLEVKECMTLEDARKYVRYILKDPDIENIRVSADSKTCKTSTIYWWVKGRGWSKNIRRISFARNTLVEYIIRILYKQITPEMTFEDFKESVEMPF